jgi:hypothetical protein
MENVKISEGKAWPRVKDAKTQSGQGGGSCKGWMGCSGCKRHLLQKG